VRLHERHKFLKAAFSGEPEDSDSSDTFIEGFEDAMRTLGVKPRGGQP
jgi:hypothetical protein